MPASLLLLLDTSAILNQILRFECPTHGAGVTHPQWTSRGLEMSPVTDGFANVAACAKLERRTTFVQLFRTKNCTVA